MHGESRIEALSNGELVARIDRLAGEEREVLCRFLEHLSELERRKLHVELGFSSVFSYLTRWATCAWRASRIMRC